MKSVRPYGQSVIQKENDLITNRKILPKKQNRNDGTSETQDINFLAEQYDFQLALWISTIDKIFKKPKNEYVSSKDKKNWQKLSTANFFNARQELGIKCWELFSKRINQQNNTTLKAKWDAKIHPYIKSYDARHAYTYNSKEFNGHDLDKYQGRLYNALYINTAEKTALRIEDHIYNQAFKAIGNNKKYRDSVINQRIDAIEKSVTPVEIKLNNMDTIKNHWECYFCDTQDCIKDIYNKITLLKNNNKPISKVKLLDIIMPILQAHWDKLFQKHKSEFEHCTKI